MTKARIREIKAAAKKCGEGWMPAMEMMVLEVISELERIQSFTRRGVTPSTEPEDLPKKAKGKAPADPRIVEFTEGWVHAYKVWNGEPYPHGGAKDVQAIKRLLILAQVDDLLDTAYAAWQHPDRFNCSHAITIAGFCSRYANVKQELKNLQNGGRPMRSEPAGVNL